MSSIVGPGGRPIEEKVSEEKDGAGAHPTNGKSNQELLDIRTVETGTLVYNLVLATQDERAVAMAVHQMEMMKAQQKMVVDPPPLEMAKQQFEIHEKRRFAMANELNQRFRAIDAARLAEAGIEVVDATTGDVVEADVRDNGVG